MKIFSCKKPRYNEDTSKWELEAIYALNEHSTINSFDTEEELQVYICKMIDGIQPDRNEVRGELIDYV